LILACQLSLGMPIEALSASPDFGFADRLMRDQRFAQATIEYERAIFLAKPEFVSAQHYERWLNASFRSEDYWGTLKLARRVLSVPQKSEIDCVARFYEARGLYALENFRAAGDSWRKVSVGCAAPLRDEADYRLALAQWHLGDWEGARDSFRRVSLDSSWATQASMAAQRTASSAELGRVSPNVAMALNAVAPGAGYAYAHSPKTAVAAVVTNGLFIWGTYSAIRQGQLGVAAVLSLFSAAWYFGGIYGAGLAADRNSSWSKRVVIGPFELN